jgi:transcriptional regulator with XRE-family HTH domain
MTQSEFAALCGVSKVQVTHWKNAGTLHITATGVDPHHSLANLAGTFDETKRQTALSKLEGRTPEAPAPANDPIATTFRQQYDQLRVERERLSLAKESGDLVRVKDVQRRAMEAVTRLTLSLDSTQHGLIDKIIETTNADPAKRTQLQRLLRSFRAAAMEKFAGDMARCAQVPDDQALPSFDGFEGALEEAAG